MFQAILTEYKIRWKPRFRVLPVMESLVNENLTAWLLQYGGLALFFLLAIGIIALPVPEETLMVFTGILMQNGSLPLTSTIIAAFLGSVCGITTSYFLGRSLGLYFIHKYGKYLGLRETQLASVHSWFERWGKWTLLIGYFIPGIRHFTGFTAGTTYLSYKQFAIFAYTGAFFWVATFLSVGYFFGTCCVTFLRKLEVGIEEFVISAIFALFFGFVIYHMRRKDSRK